MFIGFVGFSYAALALGVLLGTLGAPLPLGVAFAAMGVLARHGEVHLALVFLCGVGAAVLGDNIGYLVGRHVVPLLPLPLGTRHGHRRAQWLLDAIERHGHLGMAIFLTRWSLTAPATLVNLIAGYRRYRWSTFAAIDLLGQSLWVALALAPGYLLGSSWIWGLVQAAGITMLVALVAAGVCRRYLRGTAPGATNEDTSTLAA